MKKIIFPIVAIGLMSYTSNAQQKPSDFNTEIEKWKKELVLNGEVGKPCREDDNWDKWQEENPNAYFGLEEIQSMEYDFNSDGIKDGLFYFPAYNCVGGNGIGSDFALLVYSNNGQLLTNKNITKTIQQEIKYSFEEKGIYDIYKIILTYKGLGKTVVGDYSAWTNNDASCCNSFSGTFEYNPIDFSLTTENKTNSK